MKRILTDTEFLRDANTKLGNGLTIEQTAKELGIPLSTFYNRVRGLGYEFETYRRLVPKRAPELDSTG